MSLASIWQFVKERGGALLSAWRSRAEYYDLFLGWAAFFLQFKLHWITRALRWGGNIATLVASFTLGGIYGDIASKAYQSPSGWGDLTIWKAHWHFFVWLLILFLGGLSKWIGSLVASNSIAQRSRVQSMLEWFYEDMKFSESSRVRCTVWVPLKLKQDAIPVMLTQLVDYVPMRKVTQLGNSAAVTKYGRAGRPFCISRPKGKDTLLVGVMGRSIVDSLSAKKPKIHSTSVPPGMSLVTFLTEQYNFTKRHAERMTPDRKSFVCLPILTSDGEELICVVYLDASAENAFTPKMLQDAQKFLPRIARTMSK